MSKFYVNEKTGAIISESMLQLLEDKHDYTLFQKKQSFPEYVLVQYPQIEAYKDKEWFKENAVRCDDIMRFGRDAYFIPKWLI